MKKIRFLKSGMFTTIQDLGRKNCQKYGIPLCGAVDEDNAKIANLIVGNKMNAPLIEFTYTPPEIFFENDFLISITGGNFKPLLNDNPVNNYECILVKNGDVLSFSGLVEGFRGYIGINGEINGEEVFNSKSTYTKNSFGGYYGNCLKNGDALEIENNFIKEDLVGNKLIPEFFGINYNRKKIRFFLTFEHELFDNSSIEAFFNSEYNVSNLSDRMGIRLTGSKIIHKNKADIISSPVFPGVVQVPKDGQPIILLNDCQITGGYTRLGVVSKVDFSLLSQKKSGDIISFEIGNFKEMSFLLKEKERKFLSYENKLFKTRFFKVTIKNKIYNISIEEK